MKLLTSTLFLIVFLFNSARSEIIYTDPKPGAEHVNINNTIVIGTASGEPTLQSSKIIVSGSTKGNYNGNLIISGNKLIFKPETAFNLDETITIYAKTGSSELRYSFKTQREEVEWNVENTLRSELGEKYPVPFIYDNPSPPTLSVLTSNNPSPGKILMASFVPGEAHLLIAENNGSLFFSNKEIDDCYDFKRHPDGTFTYFHKVNQKFYQLDTAYNLIDSFYCGNGYVTDLHELIFADNGNVLLMSYDTQIIDMRKIYPGGDSAAKVTGLIIQELDRDRNVVFQWRSWDHFSILDATHLDFTAANIDYVHANAIEIDNDNNLMISSRHMDEVTKINRTTGDIIWRLGGKNNEFEFINDPYKFSYQHDIRRIDNGNITLYDNGNFHSPQFSRAVEYELDETNKKVTLVWQYRNTPDVYGFAMGSARRLSNGNTIIGWGYTQTTLTEVTPEGNKVLEMKLPSGMMTYRVHKSDWNGTVNVVNVNSTIPEQYSLSQNYPNPFNPSTTIEFSLPVQSNVSIKLYNIIGKEAGIIFKGIKPAGSYKTMIDASSLPSGVYIYRLETDHYSESKKMILMK
jgi:hypothetical protein